VFKYVITVGELHGTVAGLTLGVEVEHLVAGGSLNQESCPGVLLEHELHRLDLLVDLQQVLALLRTLLLVL